MNDGSMTPSWLAFRQQADLRLAPSCPRVEWEKRCPPGATMLLAEKRRGGCRAAGCVAVGGEPNDNKEEQDESEILRAVTAQQTALLQAAKPATPKTFYQHVVGQQRAYGKDEKRFMKKLAKATKSSPSGSVDTIRGLVEEAATKGFRSVAIEEAAMVVAKQEQQERVLAFFRSLPGAVVDYVSTTSLDAARRSNALKAEIVKLRNTVKDLTRTVHEKELISTAQASALTAEQAKSKADRNEAAAEAKYFRDEVEALRATVDYVLETAASDHETSARTEGDLIAKLDTAEGIVAALTDTVAEQQLAAQKESERSDLSLRLVEQEAAMARASTLAIEEELSEAEQREIELQCLLDVGTDTRKELEDELALCRTNVNEARAIAESYGADIEDLDSRALAVALALADDVAEKASTVESLAHVAEGAVLGATPPFDNDDRWGSHAGYPMIRSHLEAVQRLVLTTTSTLVEEVSCCEHDKAEAVNREARTQQRMKEVEDELTTCHMSDASTTHASTPDDATTDPSISDSTSTSDAASDRTVTGVDTVENDTDTAGAGEAVDRKEVNDDGGEGGFGIEEDDAYSSGTSPPTLDGV
ncbi:expressed unknown protein [Ectocarpus siliculosus]|nr:expressed unknown protein [Ectocarpus siliculosus]|eukprot:CBJ33827.1 expressed unknown protein [Ectocarpus siliculosus]